MIHDSANGDLDTSTLALTKNKRLFDIRLVNGKRLWLKVPPCTLKYGYTDNQYKSDSPGTMVLTDIGDVLESVEAVDRFVVDQMISQYKGTSLNNIMITENTVHSMFRPSVYRDTLRLSVDAKGCHIYDKAGKRISNPKVGEILAQGVSLTVLAQPSFAWMMGQKIGVRWDARQIKLADPVDNDPFGDPDEDPGVQPSAPRSISDTLKLFGDDEE